MTLLLVALEKTTNGADLFGWGLLARECLHDELRHRAAEGAFEQIAHQATLRGALRLPGAIAMLLPEVLSRRQPLLRHDLQQLERGGVGERAPRFAGEVLVHLADGGGAACPEHAEDGQLGIGRPGDGHGRHVREDTYEDLRMSTKIFVAAS